MTQFIDLLVTVGPDEGMRFSVELGTYRCVGRFDVVMASTDQLTSEGARALNADQQGLLEEQVVKRGHSSKLKYRRRGPDVLLNDATISRLHALILFDGESITIADLMSTNGTKVNDLPIRFSNLVIGDVIHLGKTKLQVSLG